MFLTNPISFVEYLSPTVFTGCLGSQHSQLVGREQQVVIGFAVWKNKIWSFMVFRHDLFLKAELSCYKDLSQMMFERLASA